MPKANWRNDYRFEKLDGTNGSWVWNSLTSTGKNTTIQSPWNFDANNGGFTVGLVSGTNTAIVGTIANWGEDKNYNNVLDAGEDRDPVNNLLDNNWNTRGGCGWQTKTGNPTTGGAWHTGRIDLTTLSNCLVTGSTTGQCQNFETYPGSTGKNLRWDLLRTPVVETVNQAARRRRQAALLRRVGDMALRTTPKLEMSSRISLVKTDGSGISAVVSAALG